MSLIDKLPTVEKCCLCINLKCGTILIAILGMFSVGIGAARLLTHDCLAAERGTLANVIKIYAYAVAVGNRTTATWFIYAGFAAIIVLVIGVILLIVNRLVSSLCPLPLIEIISSIVTCLVWIYFIAVVKSYQSEM
ncbi:hypothetical protein O3G_MSEX001786 [Manduca sexta]|uniref:Uncharacterized protein n=1 Tax=Manduca sexta TaxID=7130 RepID=A0A921YLA3_MANSE|nr:hypothetical protein O3G_MSEX001786 [Manduca sexta]